MTSSLFPGIKFPKGGISILPNQTPDPSGINITTIIACIAAVLSAGAACFTALYNAFARAKRKAEMHKEYGDLSEKRRHFWETMDVIYRYSRKDWGKQNIFPEKLYEFVIHTSPPHVEGDVVQWVEKNLVDPETRYIDKEPFHKKLWELASFVYPEQGGVDHMFMGEHSLRDEVSETRIPNVHTFHSIRAEFAWFWDKWMPLLQLPLLKTCRYLIKRYDSAKPEVYLLVWLELALAHKIGQPGRGKIELFRLASRFHSKRYES